MPEVVVRIQKYMVQKSGILSLIEFDQKVRIGSWEYFCPDQMLREWRPRWNTTEGNYYHRLGGALPFTWRLQPSWTKRIVIKKKVRIVYSAYEKLTKAQLEEYKAWVEGTALF